MYETILARAKTIWEHAQDPVQAAIEQAARDRSGRSQEMAIGGGRVLFASPDPDAIFRATGWIVP